MTYCRNVVETAAFATRLRPLPDVFESIGAVEAAPSGGEQAVNFCAVRRRTNRTRLCIFLFSSHLFAPTTLLASERNQATFLETFKRLALEESLSVDDVESLTGWKLKSRQSLPEYNKLSYLWTGEIGRQIFEVSASVLTQTNHMVLSADLPRPPFCIDRRSMLSTFGDQFSRSFYNFDFGEYPDENSLPVEVRENLKYFGWAPYYRFASQDFNSEVKFDFTFSKCASSISVQRVPVKQ